ncbi:unnamed protein product [Ilex paraguariensis]|uniref:Uncharacterized protein n=1 Tax=Ilex paraguariensis TaxID=185542 RepID=A0ABC8UN18_9AQUA
MQYRMSLPVERKLLRSPTPAVILREKATDLNNVLIKEIGGKPTEDEGISLLGGSKNKQDVTNDKGKEIYLQEQAQSAALVGLTSKELRQSSNGGESNMCLLIRQASPPTGDSTFFIDHQLVSDGEIDETGGSLEKEEEELQPDLEMLNSSVCQTTLVVPQGAKTRSRSSCSEVLVVLPRVPDTEDIRDLRCRRMSSALKSSGVRSHLYFPYCDTCHLCDLLSQGLLFDVTLALEP